MHKHHNFKTGLIISIILFIIIICVVLFQMLPIKRNSVSNNKIEIALLTDSEGTNDDSYNQYSYTGVKEYCSSNKVKYEVFTPVDSTIESYLSSIDDAVKCGAKLIICSNPTLSEAVYQAQSRYDDVYFVLVDCIPTSGDGLIKKVSPNVIPLLFDHDESGFIAGYCSVIAGHKNLAVLYNSEDTTESHYYWGYIQGASYAAKELDIDITIKVKDIAYEREGYATNFAKNAFASDTEIILTCNNIVRKKVNAQAKKFENRYYVNAGSNANNTSRAYGSVVKNIAAAVHFCIQSYFDGSEDILDNGNMILNSANNAIYFELNDDVISDFPMDKYNSMYKKLSNGDILIISDTTVEIDDLELTNTTVKIITS